MLKDSETTQSLPMTHIFESISNVDAFLASMHSDIPRQKITTIYLQQTRNPNPDSTLLFCELDSGETTVSPLLEFQ